MTRCKRCGHDAEQHNDTGCHVRMMSGWDDVLKGFTKERPCECIRYMEPYNVHKSDCPHEFTKESGGRCAQCGTLVAENAV